MNNEEIDCQGEGCGRIAKQVDNEDWYSCDRCGWAGSEDNPIVILKKEVQELNSLLRDCHDLLNDCGYFFVNGSWVDSENMEEEE